LDGPYDVEVRFRFQSPQKPKYKYPSRTDIDKLCRSTLDGIVAGGIITDDRHITRLTAQKEYGTEGCVIFVRSLA
jgi:Holliday junction resolvase RusA-like endonuclease